MTIENQPTYYESTPTSVVSARVPVPTKMQLMELAMKYKMSQGEYLSYLVIKLISDSDAFDPKRMQALQEQIEDLKKVNEMQASGLAQANQMIKTLKSESEALETQFNDLRRQHDDDLDEAVTEGDVKEAAAIKTANAWIKKAKELEARLGKANARLKAENITDGALFGKQTLVQF